jgi:hypothetical protein
VAVDATMQHGVALVVSRTMPFRWVPPQAVTGNRLAFPRGCA